MVSSLCRRMQTLVPDTRRQRERYRMYESGDGGNDRHNRHASGECDGQGEDYGYLLHDRVPLFADILPVTSTS